MDWSALIGNYDGPLSVGWSLQDGKLVIRIHVLPGATIEVPDSIPVIVHDDFEVPQAL